MSTMEDEKLVESVRTRPVLYKVKMRDYRNIDKKEQAWEEVANEVNQPGSHFPYVHVCNTS